MSLFRRLVAIQAVLFVFCAPATAQPSSATLFQNVRVFDGKNETLSPASNLLVMGNVITKFRRDHERRKDLQEPGSELNN
jgi:hypothetical protein